MTINSRNRTSKQWATLNCQQNARKWYCSVYMLLVSDDPLFYGQEAHSPGLSRNGAGRATKSLSKLLSYINCSVTSRQCCDVGYSASECNLGLLQDADFAGDLSDS